MFKIPSKTVMHYFQNFPYELFLIDFQLTPIKLNIYFFQFKFTRSLVKYFTESYIAKDSENCVKFVGVIVNNKLKFDVHTQTNNKHLLEKFTYITKIFDLIKKLRN